MKKFDYILMLIPFFNINSRMISSDISHYDLDLGDRLTAAKVLSNGLKLMGYNHLLQPDLRCNCHKMKGLLLLVDVADDFDQLIINPQKYLKCPIKIKDPFYPYKLGHLIAIRTNKNINALI